MHARWISRCLALSAFVAGCSDDGQPGPSRVRVGTADMGDVVFGAVVEDRISVYVCGGPQTFATHTRWFKDGELDDDGAFAMELDGWMLSGAVDGELVTASLRDPDGFVLQLEGAGVPEDEVAGLYIAPIDGCTTGVVVRGDENDPQAQGTWCDAQANFAQVIVLEPLVLTSMGIEVSVTKPGTDEPTTFFVEKI